MTEYTFAPESNFVIFGKVFFCNTNSTIVVECIETLISDIPFLQQNFQGCAKLHIKK